MIPQLILPPLMQRRSEAHSQPAAGARVGSAAVDQEPREDRPLARATAALAAAGVPTAAEAAELVT